MYGLTVKVLSRLGDAEVCDGISPFSRVTRAVCASEIAPQQQTEGLARRGRYRGMMASVFEFVCIRRVRVILIY